MQYSIGILLFFGLIFFWRILFVSGNVPFWNLVKKKPEEAYDWFNASAAWQLADPSDDTFRALKYDKKWIGPFNLVVPTGAGGRLDYVFGKQDLIEESQKDFITQFGSTADAQHRSWVSAIFVFWTALGTLAFAGSDPSFYIVLGWALGVLGFYVIIGGLLTAHFRYLGLVGRKRTMLYGFVFWMVGIVLSNLDLLQSERWGR